MSVIKYHTDIDDIYIVIPAKDEDRYIVSLVNQIQDLGFRKIVIVNDHSTDRTKQLAEEIEGLVVLDHVINLGAGASTQTGIAYAVSQKAKIIVTIDADLQHNPKDIRRLVSCLEDKGCDLVIGSRFLQPNDIPRSRIIYNRIANLVSFLLTGAFLTDSQSGLKAIGQNLSKKLDLTYDGFEFCMEIIKQARVNGCDIIEIPVDVRYTAETTAKGQNLRSGVNMITRLFSPFN
ncbi:MAG: glycosyltransferase family 2 protein [Bacteroidota bacterium]